MTRYECCFHCEHDGWDTVDGHVSGCPVPECGMVPPLKAGHAGDQPLPTPNSLPHIQDLVHADLQERQQLGLIRYGVPGLQPHNGRDMLRDLYEELLDAAIYARAAIYERDNPR
jgi:hypothetical protein